jgi:hypothetical protein
MKPQYKIQRVEKPLDDGTGRVRKVWRVTDESGGPPADFGKKSEAQDYIDEMNEREERKPHAVGTPPDTSLHLGNDRRVWLQKQGGIQPTIIHLIDDAMKS